MAHGPMELSERQAGVLRLICDTFAPGDGAVPAASALGVPEVVAGLVAGNPRPAERQTFLRLLDLWDTRLGGLALTGSPRTFSSRSPADREAVLVAMSQSRLPLRRTAFSALKGAATLGYYLAPGPTGHSPVWDAIGYPGPLGTRADAPPPLLAVQRVTADATIDCDVVVVGSGSGGGTAAAVLAGAGLDVVVLERGQYYDDADFDGGELSGLSRLYASGPTATAEGQLSLLEGACLGGGTVVNWTTSFATPDHVREEWAALGAHQFAGDEYAAALATVTDRLGVNRDHNLASARDEALERGAKALGWHVDSMPRNVRGCDQGIDCGRCGYGCRLGAKQSTTKTWLTDAAANGARIHVGVSARRVLVEAGRATGVEAVGPDGHTLTVRARAVVAAGGSLQTPALLRRSGLTNPNIGRHLRLHPATAVWALYPEVVNPWEGTLQARYCDEHADLDGEGYGVIYETGPSNPASALAFLNWRGGRQHLDMMRQLPHAGVIGVITRDRDSGRVEVGKDGEPVVRYRLSARDREHLHHGVVGAARLAEAAGAHTVFSGHQSGAGFEPGRRGTLESFAAEALASGYDPGRCAMAALHLMGSVRMGGDPGDSALDPDGATWEVPNLVVADASTFPTSSGVNPMISVQAIAHMNATRLAARLG
ncbi:GMC family oxidoreductase N-terminal domain-containing protein [Nocardioides pantholopis]|uniref:GMC family oxidoreductase N-terminal domain-containing protein n=1 Tax=Nocardioides pantholopis TaxID=2483798 RepID=UPI0019CF6920|nr:GMC family oxidoreductase N-terminal domain-containing protein [Nocardioides pantholopis]